MSRIHTALGSVGQLKALTLPNSSAMGPRFDFTHALSQFGLQVVTPSTKATISLFGTAATSSGAEFLLGQFVAATSGQASGDIVWFTGKPVLGVMAALDSASSSGVQAWITGVR